MIDELCRRLDCRPTNYALDLIVNGRRRHGLFLQFFINQILKPILQLPKILHHTRFTILILDIQLQQLLLATKLKLLQSLNPVQKSAGRVNGSIFFFEDCASYGIDFVLSSVELFFYRFDHSIRQRSLRYNSMNRRMTVICSLLWSLPCSTF